MQTKHKNIPIPAPNIVYIGIELFYSLFMTVIIWF